ncbi:hypothetical protein FRB95_004919 [Tulasnella sp. JGI-2019a]|nr:hypothetical protein FRB93_005858 [Tulasnella sp. JGI-2019a]KAG9029767.1 hypothetical protein FRB95_004919 [Tulasnella sp. JGI-2019a]
MSTPKHFLLTTVPALGHIRAESGLVCELVKTDPSLIVTVLSPKFMAPVFSQELGQWSVTAGELSRIKVVGTGNSEKPEAGKMFEWLGQTLMAQMMEMRVAYQTVIAQGSLTCTATGTVTDYQHIPAPSAVFLDLFTPAFAPYVHETTPNVKIINLWVTTAGSILWHHGTDEQGGLFEWEARTKAVFEKGEDGGRTFDEVAQSVRKQPNTGRLLPNPDGIRMYDYEAEPQKSIGGPLPVPMIMGAVQQATQFAHASITATTSTFEPGATKVLKEWYEGELGKKVFNFGPLVPFNAAPYKAPPLAEQGPFKPVFEFLDSQPPKSVMLVSFGSVFFPSQMWQLETIFKTLLETRTPFISSRASAMFQALNPELEKSIKDSGLGLIVDYVPQREILGHPSMGAFLTHGGNNSMFESINAGILNVFWPFDADQPIHSAYMSEVRDCSWELIQVRIGGGAQPPARGGKIEGTPEAVAAEFKQILSEIKSDVGERKRKNLAVLRQQTFDALAEDGEVKGDVRALVEFASSNA